MEPKQHHTQQQQQSAPQHPDQHQNNAHLDPHSSQWQFGLFDCCGDMKACLLGCCLPCVLHGKTMQRMHDPSLQSHELLNHECMVWCCMPRTWLYNTATRTRIREKYGIEGDASSDFKTSYFCTCCALIQQDREVALRAGHYPPDPQGYQGQTQGMQMPRHSGVQDAQEHTGHRHHRQER
ncbi:hypothetical protein H634G_05284 [Metarhizium anisopliae BRIP 53293]|uniref:PLAC8 family protein n=1 Tax=Metarhizium anisopliae BRIP 53293 TaxID=1291518 RepID=A0A0D9P085_METAN|nr:hypothetical protein H634G_05284 [Metarhizium anisopliae BRIP 53293]KJK93766.1 hypothetical protein H633G_02382 [Metarhizium anisopliae BRIP 53284]